MADRQSPAPDNSKTGEAFERLCTIMKRLRAPGGCPWDARQTPESLKPYILEESYELLEAIDLKNNEKICEELGDLLLQVVFQATIFAEKNCFTPADVVNGIADKLERRHPHVFAGTSYEDESDLHRQWEAIKQEELGNRNISAYERIPRTLPALSKVQKLISRAIREGVQPADLVDPVRRKELATLSDREKDLEIGARLAEIALLAKQHGRDAETALLTWVEETVARLIQDRIDPGQKSNRHDLES